MVSEFGLLDVDTWVRQIVRDNAPISTEGILERSEVFSAFQVRSALERLVSSGALIQQTLYTNPPQTSYVPSDFISEVDHRGSTTFLHPKAS